MDNSKPLVIAHRGFSARYTENTLLAFQKAFEVGADGIECDLRMTRDGQIVCFHDETLKLLTGVRGSVEKSEWSELKNLRVLDQEPICRLEELLEHFPDRFINFEIKKSRHALALADELMKLILRRKTKAMISSFSPKILRHVYEHAPENDLLQLSPIFFSKTSASFQKLKKKTWPSTWNLHYSKVHQMKERLAKAKPITPLMFWTANLPQDWRMILESNLPIAGIITDHPDLLRKHLQDAKHLETRL